MLTRIRYMDIYGMDVSPFSNGWKEIWVVTYKSGLQLVAKYSRPAGLHYPPAVRCTGHEEHSRRIIQFNKDLEFFIESRLNQISEIQLQELIEV